MMNKPIEYTKEYKKPRLYRHDGMKDKITCVHALIDNEKGIFAGCFSETHHIGVSNNTIKTISGHIERLLNKIINNEIDGIDHITVNKNDFIVIPPSYFEVIRELKDKIVDNSKELDEALRVLKVQVNKKW